MENGMKYLKSYTACPTCGQALELSPGAETEIDTAVEQALGKERKRDDVALSLEGL